MPLSNISQFSCKRVNGACLWKNLQNSYFRWGVSTHTDVREISAFHGVECEDDSIWDVAPICLVKVRRRLRDASSWWWWRQYAPLKRRSTSRTLHGANSHLATDSPLRGVVTAAAANPREMLPASAWVQFLSKPQIGCFTTYWELVLRVSTSRNVLRFWWNP
jgi:hypothetical protein